MKDCKWQEQTPATAGCHGWSLLQPSSERMEMRSGKDSAHCCAPAMVKHFHFLLVKFSPCWSLLQQADIHP